MRVGVISDIHGNLAALETVLSEMDVEKIICCGDIVGYGPQPKECVERVREVSDIVVQGNHDRMASNPGNYNNPLVIKSLNYAQRELDNYQLQWLQNLNRVCNFKDYMIVHSHPTRPEYRLFPEKLKKAPAGLDGVNGLIFGHTHRQEAVSTSGIHFVNPGSVGQPRDGDQRAGYGVLDTNDRTVRLQRVEYNVDETIDCLQNASLPEDLVDRFRNAE